MRVRARYEAGSFQLLAPLDLPEGAEVFLEVEAADPAAWREQVSLQCLRVGTLTSVFSWFIPGGAPPVAACLLSLEPDDAEPRVLARVVPTDGALHVDACVPIPPCPSPRHLQFALAFEDPEGHRHAVAVLRVTFPACRVVFEDRLGGPAGAWRAEGTWGRLPDGVWTDSPEGDYANNANDSLTSPVISLKGLRDPALCFEEKHNIEEFSDRCYVEVCPEGGEWEALDRFAGVADWTERRYDLGRFEDQEVRLRFRLVTDRSITRDGIYIREFIVAGQVRVV